MVWVGRDLIDHLVPTPLPWAGTRSTRPGCSKPCPAWPRTLPGIHLVPLPTPPRWVLSTLSCSRLIPSSHLIIPSQGPTPEHRDGLSLTVLGLARTGLIFTGLQEGAQPGVGADPTWPNRAGYSILRDVTLGSGGGGGAAGTHSRLAGARCWSCSGERLSGSCGSLLCFLLICTIVVTVPFVCCSVKLPLSRPTGFCLFLFILLCTPAGGGAAAWRFCCRRQPKPKH